MIDTVHVYLSLHTALIKPTAGNKTRLIPSPFHVSASARLTLVGAFRSDYIAACSTALLSATEENESSGYEAIACPSKKTG